MRRQPKIAYFDPSVVAEDIGGLQVAVDHVLAVEVVHSLHALHKERPLGCEIIGGGLVVRGHLFSFSQQRRVAVFHQDEQVPDIAMVTMRERLLLLLLLLVFVVFGGWWRVLVQPFLFAHSDRGGILLRDAA
jgi:hypothetical protein